MYTDKQIQRFWRNVSADAPDCCWRWIGGKNEGGYGVLYLNDRKIFAHRMSYQINNGMQFLSSNDVIRHTCDNPSCVNPKHLVIGTIKDNIKDRQSRNRQARGQKSGRRKINEQQALQIIKRYVPYVVTLKALAAEFDVTYDQIHRIARGKSWKHLQEK